MKKPAISAKSRRPALTLTKQTIKKLTTKTGIKAGFRTPSESNSRCQC